jgi:hypothetical protein
MYLIALTQDNIVQDGLNSELVYKFPNSVNLKDKYISVVSISIFYSWYNITDNFNDNKLIYTWPTGTTYTVTIPNGLYEISDINAFLQFTFIKNGTYWTIGNLNYYPFELIINSTRYAVQLNTYLIPTSAPSGAIEPVGFAGWPTSSGNCSVVFPANFNNIVGYPVNFTSNANTNNNYSPPLPSTVSNNFVAKNSEGTLSYLSSSAPEVQRNSNLYLSMSNINNPYGVPSSIIYCLCANAQVGTQITDMPPNFIWNKLIDGTYNELRLQLRGNNFERLRIADPNMAITLAIRDKFDMQSS